MLNCGFYHFDGDIGQIILILNSDNRVKYAEENHKVYPTSESHFDKQYYLENTGQLVNNISGISGIDIDWVSAKNFYDNDWFQKNIVKVAVIDSGLNWSNNDEFNGSNLLFNQGELSGTFRVDDDGNGWIDDILGWNFLDDNFIISDTYGHGTQVASLIAAYADGRGMQGIASNVKILPIRLFGSPNEEHADITKLTYSLLYAAEMGVDIINLSLRWPFSNLLKVTMDVIEGGNILVICAAGNSRDNIDINPSYPASFDNANIISVASINQDGNLSYFSNYGINSVDIAAPGENIYAADVRREAVYYEDFNLNNISGWFSGSEGGDLSNYTWNINANNELNDGSGSTQNYSYNTNTWARSPPIPLSLNGSRLSGPELEISLKYDIESFNFYTGEQYDYFLVEASSNGTSWQQIPLAKLGGSSNGLYVTKKYSLSDFEYAPSLILRFRLVTDHLVNRGGVEIDYVRITGVQAQTEDSTHYTFTEGTSFSSPIVAGVAAMIMSISPELEPSQIKQFLINNATPLASLNGKVAAGGIVNAFNSISSIYNAKSMRIMYSIDMIDWNEWKVLDAYDNYNLSEYYISMSNVTSSPSVDYKLFDLKILGKDNSGNEYQILNSYKHVTSSGYQFNFFSNLISDKCFFKLEYN